jgi:peptidoglycan hydrolase-like protein with peptidoglycan-binding domain
MVMAASMAWAASDISQAPSSATKTRRPSVKSTSARNMKKTATTQRRYRKEGARVRLARLKLQPERAMEIQQALMARGYLNREPSGVWDDSTRDAMRRFQQEYQFPPSGLPEAKSLMKLGLGPHPLPDALDSATQARAMAPPSGPPNSTPSK